MDGKKFSKQQDLENQRRDYRDHNLTPLDTLHSVLYAAIDAVEEAKIPYALIGGLAIQRLGRPRKTHDIDFFVRPDDAEKVLETLKNKGFETYVRDPFWLYKAWKDDVLVDIIFKSSGDIYFDQEVCDHVRRLTILGRGMNAVSPEDFIVMKAAAHEEQQPHHLHDALAVLTQGDLDWDYLLKRAKHSPRRVLSFLIYAQANDVAVPSEVIQRLYRTIYEPVLHHPHTWSNPYKGAGAVAKAEENPHKSPIYLKAQVLEALTLDERIAEHDISVKISENTIIVAGEVFTDLQKGAVEDIVSDLTPDLELKNLIKIRKLDMPERSEVIR